MNVREWCEQNGELGERLLSEYIDTRYSLDELSINSGRRVKFRCKLGHEWEAELRTRIRSKTKCPYCAGKKIKKGFNDLLTWCDNNGDIGDKIKIDWTGKVDNSEEVINIDEISPYSHKNMIWHCNICEGEWVSKIVTRTGMKTYCPVCNSRKVVEGINDLFTWANSNDDGKLLLESWDYDLNISDGIDIHKLTKGSKSKAWFRCTKCGESRKQSIYDFIRGIGCNKCNKKSTSYPEQFIFWSFKSIFNSTMNRVKLFIDNDKGIEYDIYIPDIKLCIEYSPTYWHKGREHIDRLKVDKCKLNDITLLQIVEDSYNELEHIVKKDYICFHMDEHNKNNTLKKLMNIIFKMYKIDKDINFEYVIEKSLSNYSENVEDDSNALINMYPNLINYYDKSNKIDFNKLTYGTSTKVKWICPHCGLVYECSPYVITYQDKCCSRCGFSIMDNKIHLNAIKEALDYTKSIEYLYPKISAEIISDIDCSKILPGSNKKVEWRCSKCGNQWVTSIQHRIKDKSGCPKCHFNYLKDVAKNNKIKLMSSFK